MQKREISSLKKEKIGILDRQWIWANYLRELYESELSSTPQETLFNPLSFYANKVGTYMLLWYALLFSVLEGLRKYNVEVKTVQEEINELYPTLKELRHAVFHSPYEYLDKRWFKLLEKKAVGGKIRIVHDEIGKVFLQIMQQSF